MTGLQEGTDTTVLLTRFTAKSLLCSARPNVFKTAEDDRMWSKTWIPALRAQEPGSVLDQLWDSVLLRTFDAMSGSQPDAQYRMLARDARMRLDTAEDRKNTLTTHGDHRDWTATPYISFTSSPDALQQLANSRMNGRRGDQYLVVVDPRIRIEIGLPVLHYKEEKEHYGVQSRYERDYWSGHYLCLWEVTPEEVVDVWAWNDLRSQRNWFEETVMPAVEIHRENRERCLGENKESLEPEDDSGRDIIRSFRPEISDESDVTEDDDTEDNEYWSESDDSDERVVEENWTGELMKMYEDLRLD